MSKRKRKYVSVTKIDEPEAAAILERFGMANELDKTQLQVEIAHPEHFKSAQLPWRVMSEIDTSRKRLLAYRRARVARLGSDQPLRFEDLKRWRVRPQGRVITRSKGDYE